MLRAAVMHELVAQFLHDSIEHRSAPAPFEDPLGRLIVGRLAFITLFAGRDSRANGPRRVSARGRDRLVGQKELQGGQNKSPEPPLFRVGAIEIPPFEHADEKLLREILRLIGRITAAANIAV